MERASPCATAPRTIQVAGSGTATYSGGDLIWEGVQ
jgi:hypothetical protein